MLTSHSQTCLPVLESTALNHSGELFVTKTSNENVRPFYANVTTVNKLVIWAQLIL